MDKKYIKIFIFLGIMFTLILVAASQNKNAGRGSGLDSVLEVSIPKEAKLVATYSTYKKSFIPIPSPGRRSKYFVYKFDKRPEGFLDNNHFSAEDKKSFEFYFNTSFWSYESEFKNKMPEEHYPNWNKEYIYLMIPEYSIYFAYFVESGFMMVIIAAS